ncbi:34-kDa subunit of RNA polymerase III (C) [Sorochytrium milnesiophthora]
MPKKLSVIERQLLEAVAKHPDGAATSDIQREMPGVDMQQVVRATQLLLKKNLMEVLKGEGGKQLWRAVKEEEADKLGSLEVEEKMVYQHIKASGNEGIWIKTIKARTNLHQNVFMKALKALETKRLIKPVKSIKFPQRKTYMVYELQPSQEVTGGPWFTDQELDTNFIETVAQSCLMFITKSVAKVRKYIKTSRITNVDLTLGDIATLLDTLVYDGKVERIPVPIEGLLMDDGDDGEHQDDDEDMLDAEDEWMYRATRERLRKGNAVHQVPCDASILDAIVFDEALGGSVRSLASPPPPYSVSELSPTQLESSPLASQTPVLPPVDALFDHGDADALQDDDGEGRDPKDRLQSLFPHTDPDMIDSILEAHAQNFELAYEYMRQYPDTFVRPSRRNTARPTAAPPAPQPPSAQLDGKELMVLFLVDKITYDSRFKDVPEDVVRSVAEEVGLADPVDGLRAVQQYLVPLVEAGVFAQ